MADRWREVARVTAPSGVLVLGDLAFLLGWPEDPEGCWLAAAAAATAGGGAFDADWISGVAVPVPTDRPLPVRIRPTCVFDRTPSIVEVVLTAEPIPAVDEVPIGQFPVDGARMTIADAVAMAEFRVDKSWDGLADVAFWGEDQRNARSALGGTPIRRNTFGWRDLAPEEAASRLEEVRRWAVEHHGGVVYDLWPHDDVYRLDESQAASRWGVGVATVGGQQICDIELPGDGYYPVTLGRAAGGRPAAVQVHVWGDGP